MPHIGNKTNEMMSGMICDCGHDYICHAPMGGGCCECSCSETRSNIVVVYVRDIVTSRPTTGAVDVALLCDCGELFPESGECKFCGAVANPPRH